MEEDRYTRITLRIPRDLHSRLQAEADRLSHSQNAEIVSRLEASFGAQPHDFVATEEVIQGYRHLADSLLMYLLSTNADPQQAAKLKNLTEALKRATEDALEVVRRKN